MPRWGLTAARSRPWLAVLLCAEVLRRTTYAALAGMSDQRARPGLTSSKLLEWYAASCGHTILVGYERLAVAATHGNLHAGRQPSMAQAARCAFTRRSLTRSVLRVTGRDCRRCWARTRRGREAAFPTGLIDARNIFGQAFLITQREFSRPINKNDGGDSTGCNFFLLRVVKVPFLRQLSHIYNFSLSLLFIFWKLEK